MDTGSLPIRIKKCMLRKPISNILKPHPSFQHGLSSPATDNFYYKLVEIFRACKLLKANIIMINTSCQRNAKVLKIQPTAFI